MKIRFLGFLMWLLFFGVILVGGLGLNLTKVQAQVLPPSLTVQFTTTALSGSESVAGEVDISLSSADPLNDTTVDYRISGTSTAEDYTLPVDGKFTIKAGETIATLKLGVIDDQIAEPDETIVIGLYNPSTNVQIGSTDTFTYTILNDDLPVTLVITNIEVDKDGWFTTAPTITLTSNSDWAKVYYRWNSGDYREYTQPIISPEDINTLDYYAWVGSADNNKESSHFLIVQVETTPPVIPPVVPPVIVVPEVVVTPPPVLEDNSEPAEVIEIQPVVEKKISTGISTFVAQVTPEPVVTPEVQGEAQVINTPNNAESKPEESRNWNKLLLIISILIIAAGVATGGYYGYEWYMNRKDDEDGGDKSKNKSRW